MAEAKPFAAFDVDGTIFKSSLLEKVVQALIEARLLPAEPFNQVYESRNRWQHNNNEGLYHAYLDRLVGTFVSNIGGVNAEHFQEVTGKMLSEHGVRKFAFPRKLIRAVQDSHFIIAMSGSPEILVKPFLGDLPIADIHGSRFQVIDGKFTGRATPAHDKGEILDLLQGENIIKTAGSLAVGDTINDKSMLSRAENPIMFNASQTLTNYGSEFHWPRSNEVKDQITVMVYDDETKRYVEKNYEDFIDGLRRRA